MKNRVCAWDTFEDDLKELEVKSLAAITKFYADRKAQGNHSKMAHFFHPHMTLALPLDPKLKLEITKTHAIVESDEIRAKMGRDPYTYRPSQFDRNERIRVAYLSADFKLKATAYLVNHMYQFHNRDKYEVFCLANTEDSPEQSRRELGLNWRQDIADSVEHFIDVSGMTSEQVCFFFLFIYIYIYFYTNARNVC
jgi:predicted O-linked N-acetylglucosamine transferase (SPINDLY family)